MAVSFCGVMKCCDLLYRPDERIVGVLAACSQAAKMWDEHTDISRELSLFFFCHLHQGILMKRSGSSLNKEWKKKYVTLSNDGILSYHSSVNVSQSVDGETLCCLKPGKPGWLLQVDGNGLFLARQDYMLNAPGKEMDLLRVTVKVPGKRPPRAVPTCGPTVGLNGRVKDVLGPEGVGPGQRIIIFYIYTFNNLFLHFTQREHMVN